MTVWVTSRVATVPRVRLGSWRVFQVATGSRHFAGENLDKGTGRVSTAVVTYDGSTHRGLTESGRVYELVGPPADEPHADATYVWQAWCVLHEVRAWLDVTHEYADASSTKAH